LQFEVVEVHDVASSLFAYRFVALANISAMTVLRLCFFLSASVPTMRSTVSGNRTCTDWLGGGVGASFRRRAMVYPLYAWNIIIPHCQRHEYPQHLANVSL